LDNIKFASKVTNLSIYTNELLVVLALSGRAEYAPWDCPNFLIDGKGNSQKISLLNSWLAQVKSCADVPPAIKHHTKTEFKIPSAIYGKLLPEPTTSLVTMSNYTLLIQVTSGWRGPTAELASFFSKDWQPCSITSSTFLCLHQLHIPEHPPSES
jgi:hypothetical protein